MKTKIKTSITRMLAAVLAVVFSVVAVAQDETPETIFNNLLEEVSAERTDKKPSNVKVLEIAARSEAAASRRAAVSEEASKDLDEWEPRPVEAFSTGSEPAVAEPVVEVVDEPAIAEEPVTLPVVEEAAVIVEEDVVDEPIIAAIPVAPEPVAQPDPLAEVLTAVKAATNVTETVEEAEGDTELVDDMSDDVEVDDIVMDNMEDATIDSDGQLISVRLNKVGLEDAITLFAQLSGANIIVPELTDAAQISVNLKDVEWRPALQSILDSYNYELYQKVPGSNVFSVRRRAEGAPEPMVVETFKLQYATVPNAAKLVRELLPPEAKVSEFASRNMLVVKSTESAINEIRTVLQEIDEVRQQVFIESKFMELTSDAQKDLGIDWRVLQSYGIGTLGSPQYSYSQSNRRANNNESTSNLSRERYTTAEGQLYDPATGFINQGSILGGVPVLEGLTPSTADKSSDIASRVVNDTTTELLTSVLSADQFRVILSALEENKGVNIVSNPKIIVANEEKANISIIRREPNLKQERKEALNDSPDSITYVLDPKREFFDFGIKLDVTPSINTSSNITVKINPSLTRKFADKQAGASTYPIIDEKSIQTVFNLASGQTAAIGGLTELEDSDIERRVPFLGRIPYLGKLFSYKQTVQDQHETIIFVTVGLANTQEIGLETGLPEDTDLARRQLIRGRNKRALRKQGRIYFEQEEQDKMDDMMDALDAAEKRRQQKRAAKNADEVAAQASQARAVRALEFAVDE